MSGGENTRLQVERIYRELRALGEEDHYSFLGAARGCPKDDLWNRCGDVYRESRKARADDRKTLAGKLRKYFRTEESRSKFDALIEKCRQEEHAAASRGAADAQRARVEEERRAREEREQWARAERERWARVDQERRERAERERRAQAGRERRAREEQAQRAREEPERRAREEWERRVQAERERRARREHERRAREEQAQRAREEQARRAWEERERREQARRAREEQRRRAQEERRRARDAGGTRPGRWRRRSAVAATVLLGVWVLRSCLSGDQASGPQMANDHPCGQGGGTLVQAGSSTPGRLDRPNEQDCFVVEVPGGSTVTLETSGTTDTMGVLRGNGVEAGDDDGGSDANFRISQRVSAGTYILAVSGYGGTATGDYSLSVHVAPDSAAASAPVTPAPDPAPPAPTRTVGAPSAPDPAPTTTTPVASNPPASRPAPASAREGSLTIRALPGSAVQLNGVNAGTTDTSGILGLSGIQAGRHLLVARKEGYADAQATVTVVAGQSDVVELALVALSGALTVTANIPDVTVRIEGVGEYRLPVTGLEVPTGRRRVTASRPGFLPVEEAVEVRGGEGATLELVLERIPVEVALEEAQGLFNVRRYRDAARAAEAVVTQYGDAGEAYLLLGKSMHELGRFDDSANFLGRAIELGQAVELPAKHRHGGLGLRAGFCEGVIAVSRSVVTYRSAQGLDHSFVTTPDRIRAVTFRDDRVAMRIAVLEGNRERERNFDFIHPDTVQRAADESGLRTELYCRRCDASLTVLLALLQRARGF